MAHRTDRGDAYLLVFKKDDVYDPGEIIAAELSDQAGI